MKKKPYVRPPMRRKTAIDIAQRAFNGRTRLHPTTRDEILDTQVAKPTEPTIHPTFAGWTTDELTAFYTTGTVPERYRTQYPNPTERASRGNSGTVRSERVHAGAGRVAAPQGQAPSVDRQGLLEENGRRTLPPVRQQ